MKDNKKPTNLNDYIDPNGNISEQNQKELMKRTDIKSLKFHGKMTEEVQNTINSIFKNNPNIEGLEMNSTNPDAKKYPINIPASILLNLSSNNDPRTKFQFTDENGKVLKDKRGNPLSKSEVETMEGQKMIKQKSKKQQEPTKQRFTTPKPQQNKQTQQTNQNKQTQQSKRSTTPFSNRFTGTNQSKVISQTTPQPQKQGSTTLEPQQNKQTQQSKRPTTPFTNRSTGTNQSNARSQRTNIKKSNKELQQQSNPDTVKQNLQEKKTLTRNKDTFAYLQNVEEINNPQSPKDHDDHGTPKFGPSKPPMQFDWSGVKNVIYGDQKDENLLSGLNSPVEEKQLKQLSNIFNLKSENKKLYEQVDEHQKNQLKKHTDQEKQILDTKPFDLENSGSLSNLLESMRTSPKQQRSITPHNPTMQKLRKKIQENQQKTSTPNQKSLNTKNKIQNKKIQI